MPKTRRYMLSSALLSLTVIASSVAASVAEKAQDTTVCELYGQRTSPPPGRVHLKAVVYQAPRHGAALADPQCPGKLIGLRLPDSPIPGTSVARFSGALRDGAMNLSLRVFDVEVSGVLEAASSSMPKALFMIDEVEQFKEREVDSRRP